MYQQMIHFVRKIFFFKENRKHMCDLIKLFEHRWKTSFEILSKEDNFDQVFLALG